MFQNEAAHLKEWLEFHKLVGVQHFYLYNNLSSDNYKQILEPYIKSGQVTLINWPFAQENWLSIQLAAYNNLISKVRYSTKWLALLDLDEYLFPTEQDTLPAFLSTYEQFAGVCVNWQLYGTSGVKQVLPHQLLIENLVYKAPTEHPENRLGKVICQPVLINGPVMSTHVFTYKPGYYQVTPHKEPSYNKAMPSITIDKIRINHYWTGDEHYFKTVKVPRRLRFGSTMHDCLSRHTLYKQVKDTSIFRFIPELKQRLRHSSI